MKNLIKKTSGDIKADANAIFNAIDLASGGFLSSAKESIANVYRGYLDSKFNNLILDVASNEIDQDKLLSFINSSSEKDREFLYNIILKNIHADNRLTTFILAKLWANKIINGELSYYESSLLANIDTLTFEDFRIFYNEYNDIKDACEITTKLQNGHYEIAFNKFKSIGVIKDSNVIDGGSAGEEADLKINFQKTEYSDIFFDYLKEYFKSENNNNN